MRTVAPQRDVHRLARLDRNFNRVVSKLVEVRSVDNLRNRKRVLGWQLEEIRTSLRHHTTIRIRVRPSLKWMNLMLSETTTPWWTINCASVINKKHSRFLSRALMSFRKLRWPTLHQTLTSHHSRWTIRTALPIPAFKGSKIKIRSWCQVSNNSLLSQLKFHRTARTQTSRVWTTVSTQTRANPSLQS